MVKSENESRWVRSDSLQPYELYSPWTSPGQTTGVGSLSLLQGIFPTQGLNPGLLHGRRILYQLSHKGSPLSGERPSMEKPGMLTAVAPPRPIWTWLTSSEDHPCSGSRLSGWSWHWLSIPECHLWAFIKGFCIATALLSQTPSNHQWADCRYVSTLNLVYKFLE